MSSLRARAVPKTHQEEDTYTDDSKLKKRGLLQQLPAWGVGAAGAALLLLGAGAWTLQQQQGDLRSHPLGSSFHSRGGHQVFEPIRRDDSVAEERHDSLEDALSTLESNADFGSGSALPRKTMAESGSRAAKRAEERRKKAEAKISEEEKEKARGIIRETLKKLDPEGDGGKNADKQTRQTIHKLKHLLGEDLTDEDHALHEKEKAEIEKENKEAEQSHADFAKALKEEHEKKVHIDLKTVRKEFKKDFEGNAKALLCSGCKLVSARLISELDEHDVHDQEGPAQMLAAKRKAIDSTCASLRHMKVTKAEDGTAHFEAAEVEGDGEREGKRLCAAILEESRFSVLERLIQQKVPEMAALHGGGRKTKINWEKFLCADLTRLCKRREVKDDDDMDDED
eukprot:TRINITY_DN95894_c0_g1_i1.p1 TRINITY_DN95894_c0_g1~~TRINITY_DN95894_c0_g1_i1.p1  ORF type:complete len:397 (+),score=128.09 TRINITY_DN95894_c0_g1_i1:100-1290(+)